MNKTQNTYVTNFKNTVKYVFLTFFDNSRGRLQSRFTAILHFHKHTRQWEIETRGARRPGTPQEIVKKLKARKGTTRIFTDRRHQEI
jgi:hypothetical protein